MITTIYCCWVKLTCHGNMLSAWLMQQGLTSHVACPSQPCLAPCCSFEVKRVLGYKPFLYPTFNALLVLLLLLHVYWFAMICKIAYSKITTGKIDDVREED